ncbi:MAG TPA: cytochrome c3 family protein [Tepidisphaeraceae bacterium]|nr:cytochrome c3 family protein [Tepidisphaeraceae bacterium]
MKFAIGVIFALLLTTGFAVAQTPQAASSVVRSPHNLSASGPGKIKAASEQEVCIFCHTPHNASTIQPLWNRELPEQSYRIYSSATLIAQPGQPTGSSKLCLSCHDGTIALGNVISRSQSINLIGTSGTIPQGATNLGTDLSGDHPISFTYDANLAAKNGHLADPNLLAPRVHLENGQVQCTSCHDPHDDSRGNFLVMDNSRSQLCQTCHTRSGQSNITGHDQCVDCHISHKAPSGAMLLNQPTVTATCLTCHGGSTTPAIAISDGGASLNTGVNTGPLQGVSVAADMAKLSHHDTDNTVVLSDVRTGLAKPNDLVNCADCHEPHTITTGSSAAPLLQPAYGRVSGVSSSGTSLPRAKYEYEVCYKCHGVNSITRPFITRNAVQTSLPYEFAPNAISFHPIELPGAGRDVPSLVPTMNIGTIIYCTDCHNTDTGTSAGGGGPDGPHGSNFRPMLIAEYQTADGTSESESAYALCYRCHQRSSILGNESFSRHSIYIVDQRTPCSVCHDAHGIGSAQGTMRDNAHLMNFDTSIVQPDPITHLLEYRTTGMRTGKCYLTCHGKVHSGLKYP